MKRKNKMPQSDFLEETIKRRPVNKWKIFKKLIEVILLAVVFGVIACLTILYLSPVLEEYFFPEEEIEIVTQISFAQEDWVETQTDTETETAAEEILEVVAEEILPQDMLVEESEEGEGVAETISIDQIIKEEAAYFSELAASCESWLVTVQGMYYNSSWLDDTSISSSQSSCGAIVAESETDLYVLVKSANVSNAEYIQMTFCDGTVTSGAICGTDATSGLMILQVSKEDFTEEGLEQLGIAVLSSSNLKSHLGSRVLAVGSPMGVSGSYVSGTVTVMGIEANSWDINYKVLMTDIYASTQPDGFLVNMQGYIIGVLNNDYYSSDVKNMLSAVGITELKKVIDLMCDGTQIPHLGIQGIDVTQTAHTQEEVPLGAYVTKVMSNSPAMVAGMQTGDIIVAMNGETINSMSDLTSCLLSHQIGDRVEVTICRLSQGEYKEITLNMLLKGLS